MNQTSLESTTDLSAGFHALSDPIRIKVLELLRSQELCVCELCEILKVSQSKLSFHLKILKEAKLVTARQQGRWIYYSINISGFLALEKYLSEYRRLTDILPTGKYCD